MSLFRFLTQEFSGLEQHHLALITQACQALDRAEQCRARVEKEGMVFRDRWGQPKAHPLLTVERDARGQFVSILLQLGLDEDAVQRGAGAAGAPSLRVVPGGKRR